jgi:hypothetical protein
METLARERYKRQEKVLRVSKISIDEVLRVSKTSPSAAHHEKEMK